MSIKAWLIYLFIFFVKALIALKSITVLKIFVKFKFLFIFYLPTE